MTTLKTSAMALAMAATALTVATPSAAAPAAEAVAWSPYASATYETQVAQHGRDRRHGHDRYDDDYRYNYGRGNYDEPVYRDTRVWRDDDGRYYCRRRDGTTGMIIGGAAGALLGREVAGRRGDRTLGAILGAAGGALLGREVDRGGSRCR